MSRLILALDSAGAPNRWIDVEAAAHYYAKQLVAWSIGEHEWVLRGGVSRSSGLRSLLRLNSIIAVAGKEFMVRNYDRVPSITKTMSREPKFPQLWESKIPHPRLINRSS
jgi:hypothetical protein